MENKNKLIYARDLMLAVRDDLNINGYNFALIKQHIDEAPSVDAVEVMHGRWEEADDGDGAVCSICREDFCNIYLEVERFNYCPNCGAKMDGGVEHG